MNELGSQPSVQDSQYLPSANEVCEGYVLTRICLSTGSVSSPYPGGGVWLGGAISRPIPRGKVGGSGRGGGSLPAHTQGGGWGSGHGDVGESGWGGGVSRPRP